MQQDIFPGTFIVCYYNQSSNFRPEKAQFATSDIDPHLCSHLTFIYGALVKKNSLVPSLNTTVEAYKNFTKIKTINPFLKTLLGIDNTELSNVSTTKKNMEEFVNNTINYLRTYNFDGLDLDWQNPGDNTKNYGELVQELYQEFKKESQKTNKPRLLLTMTLAGTLEDINFDLITNYLDLINTFSNSTSDNLFATHQSPLYTVGSNTDDVDTKIMNLLRSGAETSKIILGIPTFGHSFTLQNPLMTSFGSPIRDLGKETRLTQKIGYIGYFELCMKLKNENWIIKKPYPEAIGPYAFKGDQWVSYDDQDIIKKKAKYVVDNNLGGVAVWLVDYDDYRGDCHGVTYPLIRTAKESLINETAAKLLFEALGSLGDDDLTVPQITPLLTTGKNYLLFKELEKLQKNQVLLTFL